MKWPRGDECLMFTSVTLYHINPPFFSLLYLAFEAACTFLLTVMNESTKAQRPDQTVLNPQYWTGIYGNHMEETAKIHK